MTTVSCFSGVTLLLLLCLVSTASSDMTAKNIDQSDVDELKGPAKQTEEMLLHCKEDQLRGRFSDGCKELLNTEAQLNSAFIGEDLVSAVDPGTESSETQAGTESSETQAGTESSETQALHSQEDTQAGRKLSGACYWKKRCNLRGCDRVWVCGGTGRKLSAHDHEHGGGGGTPNCHWQDHCWDECHKDKVCHHGGSDCYWKNHCYKKCHKDWVCHFGK